jgi:hypothetical protein
MLVKSSSSTKSTVLDSAPSLLSPASVSAVKANSSCSVSMLRGKRRCALTARPRA